MINSAIPKEVLFVIIFVIIEVVIIFIGFITNFWIPFMKEREYIKMEINRSDGEERKYWERYLKKFYVNHIPFLRRVMYKKKKRKK